MQQYRSRFEPAGLCSVRGCERPAKVRGMCKSHYDSWQRARPPRPPAQPPPVPESTSRPGVNGCQRCGGFVVLDVRQQELMCFNCGALARPEWHYRRGDGTRAS